MRTEGGKGGNLKSIAEFAEYAGNCRNVLTRLLFFWTSNRCAADIVTSGDPTFHSCAAAGGGADPPHPEPDLAAAGGPGRSAAPATGGGAGAGEVRGPAGPTASRPGRGGRAVRTADQRPLTSFCCSGAG